MTSAPGLRRQLGLLGLTATGICAMLGAAINVIPIMLQRNVPGIGPHVMSAYVFAALPALLAALAYASLASAMPRAGGSYVYVSRSLSPYWGFVASFSQWFGLSIAIGVVSYVLIPFIRDIADAVGWTGTAAALDTGPVRVGLALGFLWAFVLVNLRGLGAYQVTLIPMMFLMFALGSVVIVAGFAFDHADFAAALAGTEGRAVPPEPEAPFRLGPFLAASALLFSSFIGFDSIAQAGARRGGPAATSLSRRASRSSPWGPSTSSSRRPSITRFRGVSWPRRHSCETSPRRASSDTFSRQAGRWRSSPERPSR